MQKLTLEYPLSTKSTKLVWDMISNAAGLQKWLADQVVEGEDFMTFTWGHPWTERDTKTSRILEKEKIGRSEFEALFESSGTNQTAVEGINWGE